MAVPTASNCNHSAHFRFSSVFQPFVFEKVQTMFEKKSIMCDTVVRGIFINENPALWQDSFPLEPSCLAYVFTLDKISASDVKQVVRSRPINQTSPNILHLKLLKEAGGSNWPTWLMMALTPKRLFLSFSLSLHFYLSSPPFFSRSLLGQL